MPPPGEPPILPLMPASLILINGASSAGKTTLCRAVRDAMPTPFLHFSLDFFMFGANVLPRTPEGKIRDWPHLRPHVFQGFNRCLPALLDAGNNLVVDYIIETPAMWAEFGQFLHGHDVFLIGLHCPVEELPRRGTGTPRTGQGRSPCRGRPPGRRNRPHLHPLRPGTGLHRTTGGERAESHPGVRKPGRAALRRGFVAPLPEWRHAVPNRISPFPARIRPFFRPSS